MTERVTISIDGKTFQWWETINITLRYDTFGRVGFTAPWDPDNEVLREVFDPTGFKNITVEVAEDEDADPDTLITGTLVDCIPSDSEDNSMMEVSAYSKPGVLNDCNVQVDNYRKVYKEQSIDSIARHICDPFEIDVDGTVAIASGAKDFKKVAFQVADNPLSFLIELAKQRDLIITSSPEGALKFDKLIDLKGAIPVAKLEKGISPLKSVRKQGGNQGFFSLITAFKKARPGNSKGNFYSVLNPFAPAGLMRPKNVVLGDARGADAKEGSLAAYKRMMANVTAYTIEVQTWRDPSGFLWKPNTVIQVKAPRSQIYDFYTFVIKQVTFNQVVDTELATMELAIHPDAEALPWQI